MARSNFSATIRDHAVVRHKYYWPEIHLTFYIIFMIISGLFLIVRFADLAQEQSRLDLGTPWIISYGITVGALTEAFAWATLFLSWQRKLVPRVFLLYTFILLVLYITGIIGTAIQLSRVIPACRREVDNNRQSGPSTDTLIWLNQNHTCENWYVAFAFWVTSTVLMIWIMFVARSVEGNRDDKERDR